MPHVNIPGTDLFPSSICLGTGEFGTSLDKETAFSILDAYWECGGNFLDTAHVYGDWVPGEKGRSEKVLGEWMRSRKNRDQIVLATKGGHWDLSTPYISRVSPKEIVKDLDESLQFLQTDTIDLYWLHRDDPDVPYESIIETLNAQREAGKIRWFGASNWRTPRLRAANAYARAHGLQGFVADQVLWNAAVLATYPYGDPTVGWMDDERFFFHEETGMAAIPFQSQAFGLFHRMANGTLAQMNPGFLRFYRLPETTRRFLRIQALSEQTGLSITQIVLGYLRGQPFPTIPIVGCRSVEQVRDSMTAADVALTPEQILYIAHG